MNCIISFYTKNNQTELSLQSIESINFACTRWNVNHILITQSLQPEGFHDMFTKLYLPFKVKDYERCLYLDTDVVIKYNAPNPFKIYDDISKIYVVKDMQQNFLTDDEKEQFKNNQLCGPWYQQCKDVLKIDLSYDYFKNNFFNAGMFIFSPREHNILFQFIIDSLSSIPKEYKQVHQVEQALLNYTFMYYLKENLIHIPKQWNYIDPPVNENTMQGYIYHFTGWYYKEYKKLLPTFDLWKK